MWTKLMNTGYTCYLSTQYYYKRNLMIKYLILFQLDCLGMHESYTDFIWNKINFQKYKDILIVSNGNSHLIVKHTYIFLIWTKSLGWYFSEFYYRTWDYIFFLLHCSSWIYVQILSKHSGKGVIGRWSCKTCMILYLEMI